MLIRFCPGITFKSCAAKHSQVRFYLPPVLKLFAELPLFFLLKICFACLRSISFPPSTSPYGLLLDLLCFPVGRDVRNHGVSIQRRAVRNRVSSWLLQYYWREKARQILSRLSRFLFPSGFSSFHFENGLMCHLENERHNRKRPAIANGCLIKITNLSPSSNFQISKCVLEKLEKPPPKTYSFSPSTETWPVVRRNFLLR